MLFSTQELITKINLIEQAKNKLIVPITPDAIKALDELNDLIENKRNEIASDYIGDFSMENAIIFEQLMEKYYDLLSVIDNG